MGWLILSLLLLGPLAANALKPGDLAPTVTAKNQNGRDIGVSAFKGQYVLVYFYPKDDTAGCTIEAKNFQSQLDQFKKLDGVVLGVSRQNQASHQKFIAKNSLKFDLLVDTDGKFSQAFGIGNVPILGLDRRQSVLVGPDGKVLKVYDSVNPNHHAQEVLADIAKAKTNH